MRGRIEKLHEFAVQQIQEKERLNEILQEKRAKNKYLKQMNEKLND